MALNNWGEAVAAQGDDTHAATLFDRSLALRRALGDTWGIALSLKNLAGIAARRGDEAAAVAAYRDSLAYSFDAEYHAGIAPVFEGLARIALARDAATYAASLAGAAAALRASLHSARTPDRTRGRGRDRGGIARRSRRGLRPGVGRGATGVPHGRGRRDRPLDRLT